MRHIVFGLTGLCLAACAQQSATPVKSIVLADGAITANAPAGYCVDAGSSNADRGFAVMASCASLGSDDATPDVLGVATVQVWPADSGSVAGAETALVSLLETDTGSTLLSAKGNSDNINVIETGTDESTVTVHFSDEGTPPISGLGNEEWRAFTDINGRLVTVSVRGIAAAPLPDGTGSWLLNLVVTGLLASAETPDT